MLMVGRLEESPIEKKEKTSSLCNISTRINYWDILIHGKNGNDDG